ncbi:MAG: DUF937 domain-containing protein [Ignavibacteriae bacterium]|nr:DUF937 domain-containing protein [Ignavibacteriota bacterium]MCB9208515.1 DUF937 domain-containing protein [Ignavibacteriales bacterium]MCB9258376.1 DUF937 domain-containing protein [Ignavibacteriales bacterium]
MGNLLDDFMGSMGSQVTSQLSSQLGIDKGVAGAIIPQVLPMILGGLKKQKDNFGGEQRVDHILNKYGSSSVLDDIGGLFSQKAQDQNPDPALGGLLGDAGIQASKLFGKQFNLDGNTASKIIPMLAPVILGFLTQKKDSGAGSSGIASLLDADGDGSVLDDVAGFLMSGLGGSSSSSKGGGLLGGLLGSLLGGKK